VQQHPNIYGYTQFDYRYTLGLIASISHSSQMCPYATRHTEGCNIILSKKGRINIAWEPKGQPILPQGQKQVPLHQD